MSELPRYLQDYEQRQVEAARRVLVDVGQVLASFGDAIVLVGGWVPDLLLPDTEPRHSGSIDLDVALDVDKLMDGRYARLLDLLLATRNYRMGDESFQLAAEVELDDGGPPVRVDVEFLAPSGRRRLKGKGLMKDFRILQFPACAAAFTAPEEVDVDGQTLAGATHQVTWRVTALPDFLIMKAWALKKRDKLKDAYDICFCLEHWPGGLAASAQALHERLAGPTRALVEQAVANLRELFASAKHFGPVQYASFLAYGADDEVDIARQRAHQLVSRLLKELDQLVPGEGST